MTKGQISNVLRRIGLLHFTDRMRYYFERFKSRKINKNFKVNNPDIKLPPDYLIYESFQINYKKYYTDSMQSANWIVEHLRKHIDLNDKKVLDWGCGPGRIIRHLPSIINNGCKFYGTDYNKQSIDWCSENIPDIQFNCNTLEASLPYSDNFFDVIYGLSILTHLSEQRHYDWYKELYRTLKPDGIMLLTTQGDNFKIKLTDSERLKYNNGALIIRGNVKEGHRIFSAFQPTAFMEKLFDEAKILEHIITKPNNGKWLPQDIWIIKKRSYVAA